MALITYTATGPDGNFPQTGYAVNFEIAGCKIRACMVRSKTMLKLVHVRSGQLIHQMPDIHKKMTRKHLIKEFEARIQGREQSALSVFRAAPDLNPIPKGFL